MGKLIDKIIIMALTIFAMIHTIEGNEFLVAIYASIAISAVNYYLIDRADSDYSMIQHLKTSNLKEKIAFILEIILAIISLFYQPLFVILPIIIYDITYSRNYIAGAISVMAILNAIISGGFSTEMYFFIIIVSALAVILAIKNEQRTIILNQYKTLRDDSEEKSTKLRAQNTEIINARDTEIHNAQLSERNRIAREIHDNVGHTLSRAILQMGALLAIHKEEPVHSQLEEVRQTLDSAMNNIRSSVHDLHDDSIDVKASIGQMAEPLKEKYNLSMEVDIGDDMPRPVKYAIIGVTKEAISNIMKHSTNTDVILHLNEHPSMYQLIIHDFDSQKKSSTKKNSDNEGNNSKEVGMGLENIRSRVESVNGTLTISTDNGFRIFISIPK